MNFRIAALCGALALVLTACPPVDGGDDGGVDAGSDAGVLPNPGGCTEECGANLVCDPVARKCVPGCNPGCSAGQICVKNGDTFSCETPSTTCSGNVCTAGQTSCVQDTCSCLPFTAASRDSCADQGRFCHNTYNSVTQTGGECEDPKILEACRKDCPEGDCGQCRPGTGCDDRLFGDFGICARLCDQFQNQCSVDELCYPLENSNSGFCYPRSLFATELACRVERLNEQGQPELTNTFASDVCFKIDDQGNKTEDTPSGTCTWAFFKGPARAYAFTYCRSQGPVPEFGACKTDQMPSNPASTCGTGLECVANGRGNDGICMRICNAKPDPDGSPAEPGCGTDEACVNIYRFEDSNSVVGACMKTCNVFDPQSSCAAYGTQPASCVPTSPAGVQLVTPSGNGICVPQLPTPKAEGEACAETDPMFGAACQTGLICSIVGNDVQAKCVKPCDVECSPTDGGAPPARCSTEANATCGGGKTCTRVTGTTGAILGFCL